MVSKFSFIFGDKDKSQGVKVRWVQRVWNIVSHLTKLKSHIQIEDILQEVYSSCLSGSPGRLHDWFQPCERADWMFGDGAYGWVHQFFFSHNFLASCWWLVTLNGHLTCIVRCLAFKKSVFKPKEHLAKAWTSIPRDSVTDLPSVRQNLMHAYCSNLSSIIMITYVTRSQNHMHKLEHV